MNTNSRCSSFVAANIAVIFLCLIARGQNSWITWTNGHAYTLTSPSTWVEAEDQAVALGGHLVTINDAAEQEFLNSTFPNQVLWIGLTDEGHEGIFVWSSGQPVTFTAWSPDEPNNCDSCGAPCIPENYVCLNWHHDGLWNDVPNTGTVACDGGYYKGIVEITRELPAVSFHRLVGLPPPFSNQSGLIFSPTDGIDQPLGVTTNQAVLLAQSSPGQEVQGLVADGVTPLLLHFHLPKQPSVAQSYKISMSVSGGSVDWASHLQVLGSNGWAQTQTLTMSGSDAYAYIGGVRAEDLSFSGTNELTVTVSLTPTRGEPVQRGTFAIRRPPLILVHGYNANGSTWSPDFLKTLEQNVPTHFIKIINYGTRFVTPDVNYVNTYGNLKDLARELDSLLDAQFFDIHHWAFTRYDVVAHSQGGVLARMLCQTNASGAPVFASRPPVSSADY